MGFLRRLVEYYERQENDMGLYLGSSGITSTQAAQKLLEKEKLYKLTFKAISNGAISKMLPYKVWRADLIEVASGSKLIVALPFDKGEGALPFDKDILSFFELWLHDMQYGEKAKAVIQAVVEGSPPINFLGVFPTNISSRIPSQILVTFSYDAMDTDNDFLADRGSSYLSATKGSPYISATHIPAYSDRVWVPVIKNGDPIQPDAEQMELIAIQKELDEWLSDPYAFEEKRKKGLVEYL